MFKLRRPAAPTSHGQLATARAWSVHTYLIVIVVVSVAGIVAATGYGFWWSANESRTSAASSMALLAGRGAESVAASVAQASETVQGLAGQPGIEGVFAAPEDCTLSYDGTRALQSVRLDLVAVDGRVLCSSGTPSAGNDSDAVHADSDWLTEALRSSSTTTLWNTTDAVTGRAALAVVAPVAASDGAPGPVGVVVALAHTGDAGAAMSRELAGIENAGFTLLDRSSGAVVSSSRSAPWRPGENASIDTTGEDGEITAGDGVVHFYASEAVPGTSWEVITSVPMSQVLALPRGRLLREGAVGLVALLLLALAAWILSRRVAAPLRGFTDAVLRAGSDPGVRVAPAGTQELVMLADQFNSMLDIRAGQVAQMRYQASHDPLTGLPNGTLLRDRLAEALAGRTSGPGVAVLAVGIDRFKLVNDSRGHDVGDRLLTELAGRLSGELRGDDTLGRFGGDVFVMLCRNIDRDGALRVAHRLQDLLAQPFSVPGSEVILRASIGIALSDDATADPAALLREVDSALHQAKKANVSVSLYDQSLQTLATRHLDLERDLAVALQRDELFVHYQPILEIATGRTVGAEALVRWRHPQRGIIPPLDFIPVAEETGQIVDIGRFVLTEACRQAAAWAAAGHPLRMSVNVAVAQLRHDDLPRLVGEVLAKTGLPATQLCLEITESSLMTASEQSSTDLRRLRRLGVHIAIDDFGTGYSSLSYLHDMPVDELKIDRSFINRIGSGSRDAHLLEAIIGMAKALNLTVVAEGVETSEQLETLAEHDCHLAQGYLFGTPQTAAAFIKRLATHRAAIPA